MNRLIIYDKEQYKYIIVIIIITNNDNMSRVSTESQLSFVFSGSVMENAAGEELATDRLERP